jgi:hypothetical protein
MRQAFHQYFRPARERLATLWQEGLLSFDASVLLNVYGYSKKTRDDLVDFIEKYAGRVRLPHQFGLEYARNRSSVIVKQVHNYLKVEEALRKIRQDEIVPKRDHPYLSKKGMRAYQSILDELEDGRKTMERLVGSDPYADRIFDIFEGKVGKCPTAGELSDLEKAAQKRYDMAVPPGFADIKDKRYPGAYGDCIAWLQLMEIAKKENKGVILVTDDVKDDWWILDRGRNLGPRPELLEEFKRTTQQDFYLYSSENFLRTAKDYNLADIGVEVLQEVSERTAGVAEQLRAMGLKTISAEPSSSTDAESDIKASADKKSDLKSATVVPDSSPSADKLGRTD